MDTVPGDQRGGPAAGPSPSRRRPPVVAGAAGVALLAVALAAGCAQPRVALTAWSAATDTAPAPRPVTLPTHLAARDPDGRRPGHYVLRRDLELPPEWRGRDLTFAVAKLAALAQLRVNGRVAEILDRDRWARYHVNGPQSWRIAAADAHGTLKLELTLNNTWTQSAWLDCVPEVTPTLDGGPVYRLRRDWNQITAGLGLAATFISALIYLVMFVGNRRRADAGWYALEAVAGGLYPALNLNLLQALVGFLDTPVAAVGVSLAGLAGVHMMHALVYRRRPHPVWRWAFAAHVALAVLFHGPFSATRLVASTGGLFLAAAALYQVVGYARAAHRGELRGALTLSVGWLAMVLLGGVDIASWLGLGSLFGGWQGAGVGIFMIALAQSVNLSREHTRALAQAENLTRQLQERVAALEASNREVQHLNEELRHQIKMRSQQLADTLAREPTGVGGPTGDLGVGEVVSDRYRIDGVLGTGGMGVVYRATRLTDQRPCALKVIKHRRTNEHLARLSREAMVLAEIVHPNIIGVLDINVSGSGQLYIVMELVEGVSLDAHADRFGDLAWGRPVLAQTADALQAIHARQVIHRDLKPANILLVANGGDGPLVKVVDFGLAGLLESTNTSVVQLLDTVDALSPTMQTPHGVSLTQTGAILGTPLYMAPEFVAGTKEIGPPADIFSFGVIAFEVLGRRRPFRELPLAAAVHGRALAPEVPLAELCPALAPSLAALLTRCLAVDPGARPAARELVVALRA